MAKRTDIALEAKELWENSASTTTELSGVEARSRSVSGFEVTTVKILDERGEAALGKPRGRYVTVGIDPYIKREKGAFCDAANVIASEVRAMLNAGECENVLVAGLGNEAITPDSIGPRVVHLTMVTRHLAEHEPEYFAKWRRVSAIETGVLGSTGMESSEIINAVCAKLRPDRIIVVDALASCSMERICRTVQITDTGIVPGSGVGNSRGAVNRRSTGVPVIAVGVPTVMDAASLTADMAERAGAERPDGEKLRETAGGMIVTPRDIDALARDVSKLIAYAVNLALHDGLTVSDIDMFVS